MSEHVLTVVVRDQGTPAKRNFARVEIHVWDANDHAPEFSGGVVQGRVLETADIGTAVITVLASDKDHGDNAQLSYSIVSGSSCKSLFCHGLIIYWPIDVYTLSPTGNKTN